MGSLVSVILPTFNRAHCVGQAIDSVLQQTYRDFEVIVVDDGSIDGTRQLIKSKYAKLSSIKYVYQENHGVAVARNTAAKGSSGRIYCIPRFGRRLEAVENRAATRVYGEASSYRNGVERYGSLGTGRRGHLPPLSAQDVQRLSPVSHREIVYRTVRCADNSAIGGCGTYAWRRLVCRRYFLADGDG